MGGGERSWEVIRGKERFQGFKDMVVGRGLKKSLNRKGREVDAKDAKNSPRRTRSSHGESGSAWTGEDARGSIGEVGTKASTP